jgi:AcrR family transcriptional regulator
MFGRRKKHSTEIDSKEMLLRTAERLFAEHGFDAVTTRMISRESEVNLAMISYYFGSKEGLFQTLIEGKFPIIRERLEAIKDKESTYWEKIEATIEVYVDRMFDNVYFSKIIFREMSLQQRPEHNNLIIKYIQRNAELILSFFKEGIASGEFRKIDPEMTLSSMFASIFQWINLSSMSEKMLNVKNTEDLYNNEFRLRMKLHLKDMMKSHLLRPE